MQCLSPFYMRPPTPEEVSSNGSNKWIFGSKESMNVVNRHTGETFEYSPIPCGKCLACRMNYSRHWACRIMCEAKLYKPSECSFITLTYAPEAEPLLLTSKGTLTLRRKHIQDFKKRLRIKALREFGIERIRTFECGEYGSEGMRPHFHIIVFGLPLNDLVYFFTNELGDILYRSAFIESLWNYGHVTVGDLNFRTASYTARYILKKQKGDDAIIYQDLGILPPFLSMSLRPAIGKAYFEQKADTIYQNDKIYLQNGVITTPPRYFDKLYSLEHPNELDKIKINRREVAKLSFEHELHNSNLTEEEYFSIKAESFNKNAKKLIRTL